jgi:hypothetical protein
MELSADILAPALPPESLPPSSVASVSLDAPAVGGIVGERWPTLARAIGRYEQSVAERFSQAAYTAVEAGIIRLDDRRHLSALADQLGIRPFDAQLLIACAIRKWALDHTYDATPSKHEPALSFEYQAWHRLWPRLAIVVCTAAILDGLIIWKWLS